MRVGIQWERLGTVDRWEDGKAAVRFLTLNGIKLVDTWPAQEGTWAVYAKTKTLGEAIRLFAAWRLVYQGAR